MNYFNEDDGFLNAISEKRFEAQSAGIKVEAVYLSTCVYKIVMEMLRGGVVFEGIVLRESPSLADGEFQLGI